MRVNGCSYLLTRLGIDLSNLGKLTSRRRRAIQSRITVVTIWITARRTKEGNLEVGLSSMLPVRHQATYSW